MRVLGGKVQLERRIASGGMGDVYCGKNVATGADVAVKVLEPSAHPDEEAIERFRTEARISALLAHPSIVRVFDLLEEKDGTLALVMELLVGRTLEERSAESRTLPPDIAVAIAVPILGALDHAHAVGVVHRDVKPANVFLAVAPDGRVTPKLLDFGVAKTDASSVKTMDGHILGTSRYVSPEQARGQPLDGRSDLFAMGVLLYETITGESPFAADDTATVLANVIERVVDPHERIPPRLWLVLQKALAKQPYARPPSASAMASALAAAVEKDEEALARLLRDERPPLPRLDTPVVAIRQTQRPRSGLRLWPLALAATALVGTAAFEFTRSPTTTSATSAPVTSTTASVAAPTKARESKMDPPAPTPSSAPTVSAPSTNHARTKRMTPVVRSSAASTKSTAEAAPKPVATTPGF